MRPSLLNYLFSPITKLKGIGVKTAKYYDKLLTTKRNLKSDEQEIPRILDLIYHRPERLVRRKQFPKLYEIQNGDVVTAKVIVDKHIPPGKPNLPHRIRCYNNTGFLTIVYFRIYKDYFNKKFPPNKEIIVSGRIDRFRDELQMTHPDYVSEAVQNHSIPAIDLVYPLTAGITNKLARRDISEAISNLMDLPEWIEESILKTEKWTTWKESVLALHRAQNDEDIDPGGKYVRRLAFDELLANQLAMALVRKKIRNHTKKTPLKKTDKKLRDKFLKKLPFTLTGDQEKSLAEIEENIYSDKRMLRLLQGDVGSGKTIVAFLSTLGFVENKKQVAIMVPTSILAQQHYKRINSLCKDSKVKIALLTGKVKGKKREKILKELKAGEIDILIGTHALFQENVDFKNLGYVIIDEQHRFGVAQRFALAKKGEQPDVLVMTATPIPRTLTLTIYGDMEVSYIREKPKNRKKVDTKVISKYKLPKLVESLKKKMKEGDKVYWICPLIDESEKLNLTAVNKRYKQFKDIFGENQVDLIHGRMKEEEKSKIMKNFNRPDRETKLLIATTVIEVGIDISDATIMIIEHPERFGLSQLHQLRGRIGRGEKESFCILLYDKIGPNTLERLNIIRSTDDGFTIAEKDLKMRGMGEILGTRQSGYQTYKIANLNTHYDLLKKANQFARILVEGNRELSDEMKEKIKLLLYMFQYDGYLNCLNYLT